MHLAIQLEGAGWAVAAFSEGDKFLRMWVSYLSDGIGDMADAAVALSNGAQCASFAFQDEPGQYFWLLTQEPGEQLQVEVFWAEMTFSASRGKLVFGARCKLRTFLTQVYLNLKTLKSEGTRYTEQWRYNFPEEAFAKLSAPRSAIDKG